MKMTSYEWSTHRSFSEAFQPFSHHPSLPGADPEDPTMTIAAIEAAIHPHETS